MPYYEHNNDVYLPTADISADLIKRILLRGTKSVDIKQEIRIFSHKQHPLILCRDEISEDVIEDDEEILCDGCNGPVFSPPYYQCAQCRYFLHLPCANLPRNLRLPYLPGTQYFLPFLKPLKLGSKSRYHEDFTCYKCANRSNGFYYEVANSKVYLDVKCAAILDGIGFGFKHQFHHHFLIPEHRCGRRKEAKCKGCNGSTSKRFTFGCQFCKFDLHYDCMMHPSFWLYHCEECDLSFHTKCINDTIGRFKFGQKLQITSHSHPLRFVKKAAVKSPCNHCGDDIHLALAFECQTCNFHLCRKCVINIELVK